MKISHSKHSAFSMLELIFVIVILGIVSSIGANIIAQTYESYIVQRALYRATSKTELALNEIANRLRYAIPSTVGFRSDTSGSFKSITTTNSGNDKVLQWVAYDGDSFEAINCNTENASCRRSGWSGFCDIDAYTPGSTTLPTPGSHMDLTSTIIANLGGSIASARIYLPDGSDVNISGGSEENITLSAAMPSGKEIYERYKLAWSSYALSIEGGDLYLYYNFLPIVGTNLGNKKSLLLKSVSNFRFLGSEGSMRIKICKIEKIGADADDNITSCKEKVIF